MSVTLTLRAWWLAAYVAVGLLTLVPMALVARSQTSPRPSLRRTFWPRFAHQTRWQRLRRNAVGYVLLVLLWPYALWELAR